MTGNTVRINMNEADAMEQMMERIMEWDLDCQFHDTPGNYAKGGTGIAYADSGKSEASCDNDYTQ